MTAQELSNLNQNLHLTGSNQITMQEIQNEVSNQLGVLAEINRPSNNSYDVTVTCPSNAVDHSSVAGANSGSTTISSAEIMVHNRTPRFTIPTVQWSSSKSLPIPLPSSWGPPLVLSYSSGSQSNRRQDALQSLVAGISGAVAGGNGASFSTSQASISLSQRGTIQTTLRNLP